MRNHRLMRRWLLSLLCSFAFGQHCVRSRVAGALLMLKEPAYCMRSWHSLLHAPCPDLDDDSRRLRWSCWLGSGDHHGDHHRDRAVRVSVVVVVMVTYFCMPVPVMVLVVHIMALITTVMMMKAARAQGPTTGRHT